MYRNFKIFKTIKMKKVIGKIYETKNYDMFKYRDDNRDVKDEKGKLIRPHHVEHLMETISKIGQRQPISVDSENYVIDGQHRIEACRQLNIPITYIIDNRKTSTNDLIEIQIKEEWTLKERAISFSIDDDNYQWYNIFAKKYPEFSHTLKVQMLTNTPDRNQKLEDDFRVGKFKVKSYNKAIETAEMVRKFAVYYPGYKKRGFVSAILHIKEHKDFDLGRMLRKMPILCKQLMDFSKTKEYIQTLEDMYNWKETKKVYFTRQKN